MTTDKREAEIRERDGELMLAAVEGMLEGLRNNPAAHTSASIAGIARAALDQLATLRQALAAAEARVKALTVEATTIRPDMVPNSGQSCCKVPTPMPQCAPLPDTDKEQT